MLHLVRLAAMSFAATTGLVVVGAALQARRDAVAGVASVSPEPAPALHVAAVAPVDLAQLDPSARLAAEVAAMSPPTAQPFFELHALAADAADPAPPAWFPTESHERLHVLGPMGDAPGSMPLPIPLRSRAAFVYDLGSGEVLLSHAADERRPVASLTKVMAALALASEGPDLDAELCLDVAHRPSWPGAVTKLRKGTCTTGWDLVGAALVKSDNGAAVALHQVADLPYYAFVARMNEVAAELGMGMSTFADPSGAEDDNLSTARDMTRAVVAASAHPLVAPAASAPYWDLHDLGKGTVRRLTTTNALIERPGTEVLAAKTGYTNTAGHCFTGVFQLRGGRQVALTVLGAGTERRRWADVREILNWVEQGA